MRFSAIQAPSLHPSPGCAGGRACASGATSACSPKDQTGTREPGKKTARPSKPLPPPGEIMVGPLDSVFCLGLEDWERNQEMSDPTIPATVIGSWSFPGWFERFIADVAAHPDLFGPVDREEAVRDAVRLAIDDQVRAGLDRISDGEMQRVDFNIGFYEYLGGLTPIGRARHWGAPAHDQRDRYRCISPLSAPEGL